MLDGDGEFYGVVEHVGDIEGVVALWYLEYLVAVIVVVLAIFHYDVIGGVDGVVEVVEATVAYQHYFAADMEVEVVEVAVILHGKVYREVGVVDVAAFHIGKELFVEMILKFMSTCPEAL